MIRAASCAFKVTGDRADWSTGSAHLAHPALGLACGATCF